VLRNVTESLLHAQILWEDLLNEKQTTVFLAVFGVGVKGEGVTGEECIIRRFMSRTPHQLLDCLALRSFATSGSTSATSHRHVADDLQHHPRPNLYTRLHVAVTSANRSCVFWWTNLNVESKGGCCDFI